MKLTLDEIKNNLLWVVRFETGYRFVGSYEECKKVLDNSSDEVKDFDTVWSSGQPEAIQSFCKEWEESGICFLDEFYEKWKES